MFDLAWSEILLIGVVALIAIGPKDMPVAIRAVTNAIKKARRMAAEFQTHVDEMMREADLKDVKQTFNELRSLDIKSTIEKAVDPDNAIRNTFADNPLAPAHPTASEVSTLDEVAVAERPLTEEVTRAEVTLAPAEPARPSAPAFIPPALVPVAPEPPPPAVAAEAPAFIPPGFTRP
ncbi:MAG: Sec-independent protein translocase protein TatB [Acetobacteraceae bacterium]|nr:twin-arginine translocase subunit TatB [Pseudomonadota bacterium]